MNYQQQGLNQCTVSDLMICTNDSENRIVSPEMSQFKMQEAKKNGKFLTYEKFLDSEEYMVFLQILQVEYLFNSRLFENLGDFNIVFDSTKQQISDAGFVGSEFYAELFENQMAYQQYMLLRKHRGKGQVIAFEHLNELEFLLSSKKTVKTVSKFIKRLTKPTPQEEVMKQNIHFFLGCSSTTLYQFLEFERVYLQQYREFKSEESKAKSEKSQGIQSQSFPIDIYQYIEWREADIQERPKDSTYYTKQFTAFLIERYSANPSSPLFEFQDYEVNYWFYFQSSLPADSDVRAFITEQIQYYRAYEKLSMEQSRNITYLGYRIWRLSYGISEYFPALRNKYFVYSFIESFIQMLVDRTYEFHTTDQRKEFEKQEWSEFVEYLKDFTLMTTEKQIPFDIMEYPQYFNFRRDSQLFVQKIKLDEKDEKSIYRVEYMRKYLDSVFSSKKVLRKDKYLQLFEAEQKKKEEELREFVQQSENLKQEMRIEEGETFFEYIYANFVTYCRERQIALTAEVYNEFKQSVLDTMDEDYIQELEEKFQRGDYANQDQPESSDIDNQGDPDSLNPSEVSNKLRPITEEEMMLANQFQGDELDSEDQEKRQEDEENQKIKYWMSCSQNFEGEDEV